MNGQKVAGEGSRCGVLKGQIIAELCVCVLSLVLPIFALAENEIAFRERRECNQDGEL